MYINTFIPVKKKQTNPINSIIVADMDRISGGVSTCSYDDTLGGPIAGGTLCANRLQVVQDINLTTDDVDSGSVSTLSYDDTLVGPIVSATLNTPVNLQEGEELDLGHIYEDVNDWNPYERMIASAMPVLVDVSPYYKSLDVSTMLIPDIYLHTRPIHAYVNDDIVEESLI